jgi:mutator protein MutT
MIERETLKNVRVAIGIVVHQGLILITKRHKKDSFGGFWEFPGGKCEPAETPEACVERELLEEVAIRVTPIQALEPIDHAYARTRVTLYPFICRYESGEAVALSASELRWVAAGSLKEFRFPPANAGLLERLSTARIVDGAIDLPLKEA